MRKEIRDRWAEALESGKYKQGTDNLRTDGGKKFCCLGVLCDLHRKEHKGRWTRYGSELRYLRPERASDAATDFNGLGLPTPKVLKWAGLSRNKATELASMNDVGLDFAMIAKQIRRLPGRTS